MSTQLTLIDDSGRDWKLDAQTKELGRRGISAAREVLRTAPRRGNDDEPTTHQRHAA